MWSFIKDHVFLIRNKKEHLIYSDQANQSTVAPNGSSVSVLSDNNVGDEQDSMTASAKSNVLSDLIIF